MSRALQPVLRPSSHPTLFSAQSSIRPTYICNTCRHARLLKRPKRPYTFTQLVTLSDGSAFTMRTTSPAPVYRSSRDTRNVPLWNPSSKELLNVEEDEAGRLAGFRARFGRTFDAGKDADVTAHTTEESDKLASDKKADVKPKPKKELTDAELFGEFDEDDANLLEMISQFGKQDKGSAAQIARKKQ